MNYSSVVITLAAGAESRALKLLKVYFRDKTDTELRSLDEYIRLLGSES